VEAILRDIDAAMLYVLNTATSSSQTNTTTNATTTTAWSALPEAAETLIRQWIDLASHIQQRVRGFLPDIQPLLAQLSALEKTGQQEQQKGADTKAEESKAYAELMLSATLCALKLWRRCLPSALLEANVDIEKLVPGDLANRSPLHQAQFMSLLQAGRRAPGWVGGLVGRRSPERPGGGGCSPAALLAVAHLMQSNDVQEGILAEAMSWMDWRLQLTGLFDQSAALDLEPFIWTSAIRRYVHLCTIYIYMHNIYINLLCSRTITYMLTHADRVYARSIPFVDLRCFFFLSYFFDSE